MADEQADQEGNILQGSTTDHSGGRSPTTEEDSHDSNDCPVTDGEKRKLHNDDERGNATGDSRMKKQKVGTGFTMSFTSVKSSDKKSVAPISIKLGGQKPKEPAPTLKKTSATVANIFNQDSDEEEMPPEAKMRMRNIGRDTPTSAGPNSFGKTRQGFCDMKKVFEKQLKKQMEDISKK